MDPERWGRLQELFARAVDLAPAERAVYLDAACAGDGDLRRQVDSLIEHEGDAGGAIARVVQEGAGLAGPRLESVEEGQRIGPYRIERKVGEGGMAAVFLAVRDDDQYRSHVALKLLRAGMDSPDIVRRFRSERQILATLDHPNIARLLDGGETESGLPYLVMEYVDGEPIDAYCDRRRLTTEHRLEIFGVVCSAVQFAHRNLVVHRDLKPGNILVTQEGVPKLLDFGIAKLLEPELALHSVAVTGTGMRLLTPEYASPEQVRGETITTASDVYSLGVLLYELLSGRRPYVLKTRRSGELERVICEQEPERPSTAISREVPAGESEEAPVTAPAIGDARRTAPDRLRRRLSGDLDTIVLMALRKEPSRRYGSVEQLAEDIQRHLGGLPVRARKDTWRYRAGKFVRRNGIGVAAAGALVLLLAGFAATMAWQAARLARERDVAQQERETAARERETAKQVSGFLTDLFKVSTPGEARGREVTARELLDRSSERIRAELGGQPEVKARLMGAMGNAYYNLGFYDDARRLQEGALKIREGLPGVSPAEIAATLNDLGRAISSAGDLTLARPLHERALRIQEQSLGRDHLDIAISLTNLGLVLRNAGDTNGARALFERALAIREKVLRADDPLIAMSVNNLALALRDGGKYKEALPLFERALAIAEKEYEPDHPLVALALNNLGTICTNLGEYDRARGLFARAQTIRDKVLAPDHPDRYQSLVNMAFLYETQGDFRRAREMYEEVVAGQEKALGRDHFLLGQTLRGLAQTLQQSGDLDGARRIYERVLAINLKAFGPDHPQTAFTLAGIGWVLEMKGDYAGAREYYERSLRIREKVLPPDHPDLAMGLNAVALSMMMTGEKGEAVRRLYDRALSILEKSPGPDHPDVARVCVNLAALQTSLRDYEGAWSSNVRALQIREKAFGPNHPDVAASVYNLACVSALLGKRADALKYLDDAITRGFTSPMIATDPDLVSIREEPAFKAALARAQEKARAAAR